MWEYVFPFWSVNVYTYKQESRVNLLVLKSGVLEKIHLVYSSTPSANCAAQHMYMRRYPFFTQGLKELLMAPAKLPGCSGSRNLNDNISDLRAQVAANQKASATKTSENAVHNLYS